MSMKHLFEIISEGDINKVERKYREFCNLCKMYDPDVDMKEVWVKKTAKNNWAVHHGLRKLFTASTLIIDDDVIASKGIKCSE